MTALRKQTAQQKKNLKHKNVAVALGIVALVIIFYALIIIRIQS